jgi:potassium channel subfamily K
LDEDKSVEDMRRINDGKSQSEEKEETEWSWISHKSTLLGDKSETEWLLEALADILERELRKLSNEYRHRRGAGVGRQ